MALVRGLSRFLSLRVTCTPGLCCRHVCTENSAVNQIEDTYKLVRNDITEFIKEKSDIAALSFGKSLDQQKNLYEMGRTLRLQNMTNLFERLMKNPTTDHIKKLGILDFCFEFYAYPILIIDNMIDESPTYMGKAALHADIGMLAVNHALLIQDAMRIVLKNHFRTEPYYEQLLDIFRDGNLKAVFGAQLDAQSITFDTFTKSRYEAINHMKSDPAISLPLHTVMCLAGLKDKEEYEAVEDIVHALGVWVQEQDDFADLYGEEIHNGTDIEISRCSWLIVEGLRRATKQQKQVLMENYGHKDPAKISRVVETYKDIGMEQAFAENQEGRYKEIMSYLDTYTGSLPKDLLAHTAVNMRDNNPDNYGNPWVF